MEVGNGTYGFTPPGHLTQFQKDLELLPAFLANASDALLVQHIPSEEFVRRVSVLKPDLPHFIQDKTLLKQLKAGGGLNLLTPWGWSPNEHKILAPFKAFCSTNFHKQPNANWKQEHRQLYSRQLALKVLLQFLHASYQRNLFISPNHIPQKVNSFKKVYDLLGTWQKIIVKAPWSASGRGIIILNRPQIHPTYKKWINGVIKNQGFVMCEPLFDKQADFSFHFEVEANKKVKYLGMASFATNLRGQYIGNYIQPMPPQLNENEQEVLSDNNMQAIALGLQKALKQSGIFSQYTGILGIDVLFYNDENGHLLFHPCMEINLRQNMGTVALKIRELLHENAKGMWQVKRFIKPTKTAALEFDAQMSNHNPIEWDTGKMIKGYLPLTEPKEHQNYMLYLIAE